MDKRPVPCLFLGAALGAVLMLALPGVACHAGDGNAGTSEAASAAPAPPAAENDVEKADVGEAEPLQPAGPAVVINGRALSTAQLRDLAEQYGVEPVPGDYWYDSMSGLYGAAGRSAAGFMLPGHDFGPLAVDASRGDTGVFVNGRMIPQDEHMVLNLIWGVYVQPARYWLDAWGNVGYEGVEIPLGNLFVQIQSRIQVGGEGGDNIWSSRYGAGNYTPDNSAGYVSVPGHGPIGYGN